MSFGEFRHFFDLMCHVSYSAGKLLLQSCVKIFFDGCTKIKISSKYAVYDNLQVALSGFKGHL